MAVESELATILGGVLKPIGFRRRRSNWFRVGTSVYSIVNVQKSPWGDGVCYVNLGFSLSDRVTGGWQPEHKCSVRFRIDALRSTRPEHLRLLDQEMLDAMGVEAWRTAVGEWIATPIARVLASTSDLADLRDLLDSKVSGGVAVLHDARELLG